MKKTYIMILAGLAIVGASTTYCFSQSNQELAPEAMAPAAATEAVAAPVAAPKAAEFDSDSVADEISRSLETLVGTTQDHAPKAEPKHPVNDTTTNKFSSLNLQFGRNYDLGKK